MEPKHSMSKSFIKYCVIFIFIAILIFSFIFESSLGGTIVADIGLVKEHGVDNRHIKVVIKLSICIMFYIQVYKQLRGIPIMK